MLEAQPRLRSPKTIITIVKAMLTTSSMPPLSSRRKIIFILGGGRPTSLSQPPLHVIPRLEYALLAYLSSNPRPYLSCLSAGTAHVAPLTHCGYPVFESTSCASYLSSRGVDPADILADTMSYDTIGNAWFSSKLMEAFGEGTGTVVTSDWHSERAKVLYGWFLPDASLEYVGVEDGALSPGELERRKQKEARAVASLRAMGGTLGEERERWLFREHGMYSARGLVERAESGCAYCEGFGSMTSYGGDIPCGRGEDWAGVSGILGGFVLGLVVALAFSQLRASKKKRSF